ncbi:hypothetical protein Dimus_030602 [Dionaea muscipula]
MAYVISVPHHELPYGELLTRVFNAFEVPLDDKEGTGANRRRVDVEEVENGEVNEVDNEVGENVENQEENFKWEPVNDEAEVQGEQHEQQVEGAVTESVEEFFYAEDGGNTTAEDAPTPATQQVKQTVKTTNTEVDPSGSLLDFDLLHLQTEFARALQANTRFHELYQQVKPNPPTSTKS